MPDKPDSVWLLHAKEMMARVDDETDDCHHAITIVELTLHGILAALIELCEQGKKGQ